MRALLLAFVLGWSAAALPPLSDAPEARSARSQSGGRAAALQALLRGYESEGFSGTVLVAKDGRVVLHEGYGFADKECRIRNDRDTLYEVASLNKTFTAAAILQLEARGKLATTDPIAKHLGHFPPPKDQATIHHLATHSAGLIVEGTDTGDGIDREAFIDTIKRIPAESLPGARER